VVEPLLKSIKACNLKHLWAEHLLKNAGILCNAEHLVIIGKSPSVNSQQEKSAAALRLVGLAASKPYRNLSHFIPV